MTEIGYALSTEEHSASDIVRYAELAEEFSFGDKQRLLAQTPRAGVTLRPLGRRPCRAAGLMESDFVSDHNTQSTLTRPRRPHPD